MITKDDLDISTLRVLDKLNRVESKLDRLLEAKEEGSSKLYDSAEVKRMLNISDVTLWRYCNKGLRYHKGKQGRRLFYYDDLMAFIKGVM